MALAEHLEREGRGRAHVDVELDVCVGEQRVRERVGGYGAAGVCEGGSGGESGSERGGWVCGEGAGDEDVDVAVGGLFGGFERGGHLVVECGEEGEVFGAEGVVEGRGEPGGPERGFEVGKGFTAHF